jgi:putative ABC transport system permease protein
VHARTADADRIDAAVRAALTAVDPAQPQFHVQTMDAYVAKSVAQRTFTLELVAVCGAAALVIAALGVYSVVAYVVAARRRESAIRIALGAAPRHVIVQAAVWIAGLAACGIAMGIAVALVAARAVSPLLFRVEPLDPAAIAAVSAIVMGAAFAAAYLPARRAARVDPMDALRSQ